MAKLKMGSSIGKKQILEESNFVYNLSNYNSLADAIIAIGGEDATLYIPRGRWDVDGVVIPSNITLYFDRGAMLVGDCTINGYIDAGAWQIFSGAITGDVKNDTVNAMWFGLVDDGITDNSTALNSAFNLAVDKTVFIPKGRYAYNKSLYIKGNVICDGVLVLNIDTSTYTKKFSTMSFLYTYYPPSDYPRVYILRTQPAISLEPSDFYLSENATRLPKIYATKLGTSDVVQLMEGGDIKLYSTDYMSSRNNNKGDEFYDKTEISSIVSATGQIYPEIMFTYNAPPANAQAWSDTTEYIKGDYVSYGGDIYIATYPSGPSATYTHPTFGVASIGAVIPSDEVTSLTYSNGITDSIQCWNKLETSVTYYPPEKPISINGLNIEIYEVNSDGINKQIYNTVASCSRSNVTLTNCSITSKSPTLMIATLLSIASCSHVTLDRCKFSGATYHGLGYNIVHSVASIININDCESINCRDGIAGRMDKNITISGGRFDRIDDHYARNYSIKDAYVTGRTTSIPGYRTPLADIQQAEFVNSNAFGFSGSNIHIKNCHISECSCILTGRSDVPHLYGNISIVDCNVENANPSVCVIYGPYVSSSFDFVYPPRLATNLLIRDIKSIGSILTKDLNSLEGITTVDSDI